MSVADVAGTPAVQLSSVRKVYGRNGNGVVAERMAQLGARAGRLPLDTRVGPVR